MADVAMTTTAGVKYTVRQWKNATGDQSLWAVADNKLNTSYRKPVVIYCHGNGGNYDAFTGGSQYNPLRSALIEAGWVYVETLGGSKSHWGREFAMQSYYAAVTEVAQIHPLGSVVILGRSMGGTVSSSLALNPQWGLKPYVVGLCLESAVQDMYYRHVTHGYSLNGQYPEGRTDKGGDPQAFAAAVAPFNPVNFPLEWYQDMPVQFIHGTADDNVLPFGEGCMPSYNRIKGVPPYLDLKLRGLGTHTVAESKDPEVFGPTWKFMRRAMGLYPNKVSITSDGGTVALTGAHYKPGWRKALPLTP